jgi:uncharacterized membrane protein HdeD (DUF308 family)
MPPISLKRDDTKKEGKNMSSVAKGVMTLGIIFIILGIWGFFNDPILGIFDVDPMHNVVHLVSGILAVTFASLDDDRTKQFAKIFGYLYGLVAIIGFVRPGHTLLGMAINNADNFLHLFLAVAFLYFGYSHARGMEPMRHAEARR